MTPGDLAGFLLASGAGVVPRAVRGASTEDQPRIVFESIDHG